MTLKVGHALILSFWGQKYPSCSTPSIDRNCARIFASSLSKTFAANAHFKGTDRRLNWNRMISSAAVSTAAYDTVFFFFSCCRCFSSSGEKAKLARYVLQRPDARKVKLQTYICVHGLNRTLVLINNKIPFRTVKVNCSSD